MDPALQNIRQVSQLLMRAASALISFGCSSNRVELLLVRLANHFGYDADVFAMPTGVTIAIRDDDHTLTEIVRVRSWSVDLDKIDRLNQLILSLETKATSLAEATRAIKKLAIGPGLYPKPLVYLSQGMASFGLIYFLGGSIYDCLLGGLISLIAGCLHSWAMRSENSRYLADFLAAVVVTVLARLAADDLPVPTDTPKIIVGAIVIMLPGLVWVNSFHELAQKNLVSGAAKVFEAGMIALSLWFGVMFAFELVSGIRALSWPF